MKLSLFIITLPFLWWGGDVMAQESAEPSSMPEQWQGSLDVIKSKAQTLMVENNGLQLEYQQLIGQLQKLQQSIDTQQNKNEQLESLLRDRHGRTDQQVRTEDLTQSIKIKKQEARAFDEQLENLKRKQLDLNNKIQKVKNTIIDIEDHQQAQEQKTQAPKNTLQAKEDDQLSQWRKQLVDENNQEALLQNELGSLKEGDKTQNLSVDTLESQNKDLEARLDALQLQKQQYEKRSSNVQLAQESGRMYDKLKRRKDQLEADIYSYEMRLDGLRESTMMALSWPIKKKKLVHEMVLTDARNNQTREKIKALREDIDVLRDQVARLERRLDFAQGKNLKY